MVDDNKLGRCGVESVDNTTPCVIHKRLFFVVASSLDDFNHAGVLSTFLSSGLPFVGGP